MYSQEKQEEVEEEVEGPEGERRALSSDTFIHIKSLSMFFFSFSQSFLKVLENHHSTQNSGINLQITELAFSWLSISFFGVFYFTLF